MVEVSVCMCFALNSLRVRRSASRNRRADITTSPSVYFVWGDTSCDLFALRPFINAHR